MFYLFTFIYRQLLESMKTKKRTGQLLFFLAGIGSTLWFLIRVIPKPSRAAYPCMRAAAPLMSGFVVYILGFTGTYLGIQKIKENYRKLNYKAVVLFSIVVVCCVFLILFGHNPQISASSRKIAVIEVPNSPMGTPKGYWPGRVTWVMDKNATSDINTGEKWFQHTNLPVVSKMLSDGIKRYADTTSLSVAWDCLFKYFNYHHCKGWTGYTTGEKIVIKVNTTTLGVGGHVLNERMNATPEMVMALLVQLIDTVGVNQKDITVGDPYRGFPNETYNICHARYPTVHYIEGSASAGREQTTLSANDVFFTSDGSFQSRLPNAYMEACYLINMPCMKSHGSAGISLAAKNHQGSVIGDDQNPGNQSMKSYLHYDYPDNVDNQTMGMYRHLVDFMGHSKLGGNTLVYIVDAIWSGRDWMGIVEKFGMTPFNNDYTSSLFVSQDPVAIESVGFDFLYNEYKNFSSKHDNQIFPLWTGVQDYIHQAANPANWPAGINYDPDHKDHYQPIASLGVHEHWNNAADMQYSVNLTGEKGGIQLVSVPSNLVSSVPMHYSHESPSTGIQSNLHLNCFKLFPNPASTNLTVSYSLTEDSHVTIELYSLDGRKIATLLNKFVGAGFQSSRVSLHVTSGTYSCKLTCTANRRSIVSSTRLIVIY